MYGGLFGDLPAAKNESKKVGNEEEAVAQASPGDDDHHEPNKKRQAVEGSKQSSSSNLVQNLGVAGTTVAFVPTHIGRKRNAAPVAKKKAAPRPEAVANKNSPPVKMEVVLPQEVHVVPQHHQDHHHHHPQSTTQEEPEEIRQLHENVTDPYDPYVPNDLLQYWERKAAERERQEMEREAQETMERQRSMQQQIEAERQKMGNPATTAAAVSQFQQQAAMRGGGRGRGGVSNLPAWLVKQQEEEARKRNEGL